ncbi:MAG: aspartyl protease family protein [Treponema sp.]|jgi:clan AA aspartic protease|nr:aspartyl protease family protein [Treponema sp.]
MGSFTEEITLVNAADKVRVEGGLRKDVRGLTIQATPDTGAWTLVINEEIRRKLGLEVEKQVRSTLADGSSAAYGVTEPVKIHWKDRSTSLEALVIPNARGVLLGALPLEGLDLRVDPVHQRLTGIHGDEECYEVYEAHPSASRTA